MRRVETCAHLECDTQVPSVGISNLFPDLPFLTPSEDNGCSCTPGHQGRCLQIGLLDVDIPVVFADAGMTSGRLICFSMHGLELQDLPFHEVGNDASDELDYFVIT